MSQCQVKIGEKPWALYTGLWEATIHLDHDSTMLPVTSAACKSTYLSGRIPTQSPTSLATLASPNSRHVKVVFSLLPVDRHHVDTSLPPLRLGLKLAVRILMKLDVSPGNVRGGLFRCPAFLPAGRATVCMVALP